MKVAIVTNFLYPEGLGGTELYCHQLAVALASLGNEVYWMVPNFEKHETSIEARGNGYHVVKFAMLDESGQSGVEFIASSFLSELQKRGIEVAHFNEFGGNAGVSAYLLRATKKAGVSTIVTLHLVHYICQTGTMKFGGSEPCNGEVILSRCAACYVSSGATALPSINLAIAGLANRLFGLGVVKSVPAIKKFMDGLAVKTEFIAALKESADVVVSLTNWFKEVLIVNGLPVEKIVYVPQVSPDMRHDLHPEDMANRLGYVYIGRVDKPKGIDLILQIAERLAKEFPGAFIDIYGPVYGPYTPENRERNSTYPGLDKHGNVNRKGVLPPGEVLATMNKYKAVILPSLVAEMAPLIIMEANRLRIPVIVSDVPGSAELVRQYDCGLIFTYGSTEDLYKKIAEVEQGNLSLSFKQPPENNFDSIASRYLEIYRQSGQSRQKNMALQL